LLDAPAAQLAAGHCHRAAIAAATALFQRQLGARTAVSRTQLPTTWRATWRYRVKWHDTAVLAYEQGVR